MAIASLVCVIGLVMAAYLTLHLPEDLVVRHHDPAPFRAYFRVTQGSWPLKAEAVRERFGEPNRYVAGGHFPWDLTTRSQSKWVYLLETGGKVILHVAEGEVIHAYVVSDPSGKLPLDFLRTLPPSQVKVWP